MGSKVQHLEKQKAAVVTYDSDLKCVNGRVDLERRSCNAFPSFHIREKAMKRPSGSQPDLDSPGFVYFSH